MAICKENILELKKHVGIIHCSNKLTLLQRKLSNALLYNAYNDLLTKEKHEIKIGVLSQLIGYASHDYDALKSAIRTLLSTVLEWNLLSYQASEEITLVNDSSKKFSWHASSILASAAIDGSLCTYSYSPELKALLFMPEVYGKINLSVQAKFTSSYALALYENCIRFRNLHHTAWIKMETFRKLMGVAESKYKKFKDFKRRVIVKAVEEVNHFSDIFVEEELRKVDEENFVIRFKISNKSVSLESDDKSVQKITQDDNSLHKVLSEKFNLSIQQIQLLHAEYDAEYIWDKVKLIKNSISYKNKKIHNLAAYLLSAVKENFQNQDLLKQVALEKRKVSEKENDLTRTKLKKSYQKYVGDTIDAIMIKTTEILKEEIKNRFSQEMHTNRFKFIADRYHQFGLADSVIKTYYYNFLVEKYADIFTVISFDDWEKLHGKQHD